MNRLLTMSVMLLPVIAIAEGYPQGYQGMSEAALYGVGPLQPTEISSYLSRQGLF